MIIRTLVMASVMVFAGSASAALKGDIANGKKLFESKGNKNSAGQPIAQCTSCHGVGNTGKTPDGAAMPAENPILAGQYPDYLTKALTDYKTKKRAHLGMQNNASALTPQQIADITSYLGSLKSNVHDLSKHENE